MATKEKENWNIDAWFLKKNDFQRNVVTFLILQKSVANLYCLEKPLNSFLKIVNKSKFSLGWSLLTSNPKNWTKKKALVHISTQVKKIATKTQNNFAS